MFPTDYDGSVYVVPEGVVRISAGAFENNTTLNTVVLPTTLCSVGADAFFGSNITTYLFMSQKAPNLEGFYVAEDKSGYSNFVTYMNKISDEGISLTVYYPELCEKYDTIIWNDYFNFRMNYSQSILDHYLNLAAQEAEINE